MASHPPELVRKASGTQAVRRIAVPPERDAGRWDRYRPSQTDNSHQSPVNLESVVDETDWGPPDAWMKFLRDYDNITAAYSSPDKAPALPAYRAPSWLNALVALSALALVLSPLLIFVDVQAAVLTTAIALGVTITLGDVAARMRARHR